ncbi:hypothetical protein BB560_003238 [Smittium megazygosporum]|uniref:Uncharacterized protein n=1 Tax=Smittium megazygosporum TaxID=133381 RepID=A0A2T9ZCI9_9FUNG|nr:hypothetical protein BB560_003238 [Smittium megazygosporum]
METSTYGFKFSSFLGINQPIGMELVTLSFVNELRILMLGKLRSIYPKNIPLVPLTVLVLGERFYSMLVISANSRKEFHSAFGRYASSIAYKNNFSNSSKSALNSRTLLFKYQSSSLIRQYHTSKSPNSTFQIPYESGQQYSFYNSNSSAIADEVANISFGNVELYKFYESLCLKTYLQVSDKKHVSKYLVLNKDDYKQIVLLTKLFYSDSPISDKQLFRQLIVIFRCAKDYIYIYKLWTRNRENIYSLVDSETASIIPRALIFFSQNNDALHFISNMEKNTDIPFIDRVHMYTNQISILLKKEKFDVADLYLKSLFNFITRYDPEFLKDERFLRTYNLRMKELLWRKNFKFAKYMLRLYTLYCPKLSSTSIYNPLLYNFFLTDKPRAFELLRYFKVNGLEYDSVTFGILITYLSNTNDTGSVSTLLEILLEETSKINKELFLIILNYISAFGHSEFVIRVYEIIRKRTIIKYLQDNHDSPLLESASSPRILLEELASSRKLKPKSSTLSSSNSPTDPRVPRLPLSTKSQDKIKLVASQMQLTSETTNLMFLVAFRLKDHKLLQNLYYEHLSLASIIPDFKLNLYFFISYFKSLRRFDKWPSDLTPIFEEMKQFDLFPGEFFLSALNTMEDSCLKEKKIKGQYPHAISTNFKFRKIFLNSEQASLQPLQGL